MRGNIQDKQQEENNMLEKVFKLKENHTDVKTEILDVGYRCSDYRSLS